MRVIFKNKLKISILVFIFLIFSACDNSYKTMLDEFNKSNFAEGYREPEEYSVYSPNFSESEMLDDVISIGNGTSYVLTAPDGGENCSYEWKAVFIKQNESGVFQTNEEVIGTERRLNYYAPGVFNTDKENKLVLTVTTASGEKFADTARVFITNQ